MNQQYERALAQIRGFEQERLEHLESIDTLVRMRDAVERSMLETANARDALKADLEIATVELAAALAERNEARRTAFRLEGMIEMLRKHAAADRAELHLRVSSLATQNADQAAQIAELIAERDEAVAKCEQLTEQWCQHVVEQADQPQMFGPSNMREWHAVFTNMQNMITEDLRPVFEERIRAEQIKSEKLRTELNDARVENDKLDMLCGTQEHELKHLRGIIEQGDSPRVFVQGGIKDLQNMHNMIEVDLRQEFEARIREEQARYERISDLCQTQQGELESLRRELDVQRTKATQATIEKEQALVRSADTTLMLAELKANKTSWSLLTYAPAFGVGALAACVVFWLVGVAL